MSRSPLRFAPLLCLLSLLGTAPPAAADPVVLEDTTTVDRWTLPNGLDVVVRDVPGAGAISITWGYRFGADDEPADRPGLAALLAEVHYTAATALVPERTRDEMESLRPEGWSLKVTRRQTLLTETATPAQLAGVLHQVAARMRGVTVTEDLLRRARETVRRQTGSDFLGAPDQALRCQVREYARGLDVPAVLALAATRGLERVTPADVQAALAGAYVPANGALALAGDFRSLDLHAVLAREFGDIPGGRRRPEPAPARLDSATRVVTRPELKAPLGVVGLIAPALTDTLSPSFYLGMLIVGTRARQAWGNVNPPLTSRFQYALLDDPELVRFYPDPPARGAATPQALSDMLTDMVFELLSMVITRDNYDDLRRGVLWLLGGPMTSDNIASVRQSPAALNVLSSSTASRALWGSDAFWSEYRRRMDPGVSPSVGYWGKWLADPAKRVRLLFQPRH